MKKLAILILTTILVLMLTVALAEGPVIAIPNDATNEGRALLLMQNQGLLKLKDGVGITPTLDDITENPLDIQFQEVEASVVPSVLPDVDYGIINRNYAISADLGDALLYEDASSPYVNVVAVKAENAQTDMAKALSAAIRSQAVADWFTQQGSTSVSVVRNPTDGYDPDVDYDALAGTTIKVICTRDPHSYAMEIAKNILAEKNIILEITVATDFQTPITMVTGGDAFANFFAHVPYLNAYNRLNNTDLTSIAGVCVEPMGIYGGKQTDLDKLRKGTQLTSPKVEAPGSVVAGDPFTISVLEPVPGAGFYDLEIWNRNGSDEMSDWTHTGVHTEHEGYPETLTVSTEGLEIGEYIWWCGVWNEGEAEELGAISTGTFNVTLAAPEVEAPGNVVAGDSITVNIAEEVPGALWYDLEIWNSNGSEDIADWTHTGVHTEHEGYTETLTVSTEGLEIGEYIWWCGVWTDEDHLAYGNITTGTFNVTLAAPSVAAPASVAAGEPYTVNLTEEVPGALWYDLEIWNRNGSEDIAHWTHTGVHTEHEGYPETLTVSTEGLEIGEYIWWVGVWTDEDHLAYGNITTDTFTVTLAAPSVEAPASVVAGEPYTVNLTEEVPGALWYDLEIWNRNGSEDIADWTHTSIHTEHEGYTETLTVSTETLPLGEYIWWCGVWTDEEHLAYGNITTGSFNVTLAAPEVEAPASVVAGEPYTVNITEEVPGALWYDLEIWNSNGSEDIADWTHTGVHTEHEGYTETLTVSAEGLEIGEYIWWCGVWTDEEHLAYGNITTGSFNVTLAAPAVEAPASVVEGEPFTVNITEEVPGALWYDLEIWNSNGSEDIADWTSMEIDTRSEGYTENLTVSTETLPLGEYVWWVGVWTDEDHLAYGNITTGTFNVTLAAPSVEAPATVTRGQYYTVRITEPVPEALWYDLEIWNSNGSEDIADWTYMEVDTRSEGYTETLSVPTGSLEPGEYVWWVGVWTDEDHLAYGNISTGTFTVTAPNHTAFTFSYTEPMVGYDMEVFACSPGAEGIRAKFLNKDGQEDQFFQEDGDTLFRKFWTWSTGKFTLVAEAFDGSSWTEFGRTNITISSKGTLEKTILTLSSQVLEEGEPLSITFTEVPNAVWYNLSVWHEDDVEILSYDFDTPGTYTVEEAMLNEGVSLEAGKVYIAQITAFAWGWEPSFTGGVPVVVLGADANTAELTLPAALTEVEEEAFAGLSAQKVIIRAEGSVRMDPHAFEDSQVLVVEIPENVTYEPEGIVVVKDTVD